MSLAQQFRQEAMNPQSKVAKRTRDYILNHVRQFSQKGECSVTVTFGNFEPHPAGLQALRDDGFTISKPHQVDRGSGDTWGDKDIVWRVDVSW